MDPNWFTIYVVLGAAQMGTGAYDDALKSFEKGSLLGHGDPIAQAFLGWAYGVTGRKDKALEVLAELEQRRAQGYLSGVVLAMVAIGIREKDQAFQWLDRAVDDRDCLVVTLKHHSVWDGVRADPRFDKVLTRVGFGH